MELHEHAADRMVCFPLLGISLPDIHTHTHMHMHSIHGRVASGLKAGSVSLRDTPSRQANSETEGVRAILRERSEINDRVRDSAARV